MVSKNNIKMKNEKVRDEKQRFSIRKFSVGAASVLIGLSFSLYTGQQVSADTVDNSDKTVVANTNDNNQATQNKSEEKSNTNQAKSTVTDDLDQSTVVASYEANATTDSAKTESNNTATETKQDEKTATETAKTNTTAEQKADSEKNVATENAENSTKVETVNATQQAKVNDDTNEVANKKTESTIKTDAISNTNNAADVKTNETSDVSTNTLKLNDIVKSASFLSAKSATESKVAVASDDSEDTTSVTVRDADGLIDAIQNGTATTINVGSDIDLGTKSINQSHIVNIKNYRDIVIKSADDNKKYIVDFNGYSFNMAGKSGVTFSKLDLYDRSYWSPIENAKEYTFDNVTFHGSQLVYTDTSVPSVTVNFKGNVTAESVNGYTSPINQKNQTTQGNGNQQVLQFRSGNNSINFAADSNVTLKTYGSNVIEIDGGTTAINLQSNNGVNGAQVTLEPHTQTAPEPNFMGVDRIGRGIASQGTTNINIDKSSNLTISLNKLSTDKWLSGALYLTKGATIENKGTLNVNVDGVPYNKDIDAPIYISGDSKIDVNGGQFSVNGTNLNDYNGALLVSAGTSTISINHHGTFQVTGDGAQATAVSLGSGSIFTSTQPTLFNITMPESATAIKNGKVQFQAVKTSESGQPIGTIDISYAANGTPTVTKVTSYDKQTTIDARETGNNAKNAINLITSGPRVDLTDVSFTKDADGNYIMSGIANNAAATGAFVYISVNGVVHQVATTNNKTLWTIGQTGDPTSSNEPYSVETGTDGKFSVNLGKLNDNDKVSVYAAKDFVTSDTDTKTVSEWMTNSYRDQLQKLVTEAPTIEETTNYTQADPNLKTAYTSAISEGNTLLQNTSATSPQLEAAIKQITDAKAALNGDSNISAAKDALQKAVDNATNVENSFKYYNATEDLQNAYKDTIVAGNNILSEKNPTLADLQNALTAITTTESKLNGTETDKDALEAAVKNSDTVKASNNYTNADEAQKTAYDNAVIDAQAVLDKTNATQAEVNQALQDLETANNNLNGDAKTEAANKAALEAAVKDAPNVRDTPAFYNGTIEAQTAYNNAINAGQAVLDQANPSASEVKNALDAINAAKDNLKGEATNIEALETALTNANNAKQTGNYTNADKANQEALNNAITAGQKILKNTNATQAQVDSAAKAITDAITGLNGDANLANAKNTATEDIQKALDTKTTEIIDATNIDQATKDQLIADAKKAADDANTAINQATDADAVNTAKTEGITNINNVTVPSLDDAKTNAAKEIDQALTDKTKEINNAENIDQTTKDQLIKEATDAANTAKDAIEKSTTNDEATKAGQAGVDAINNVKVPSVTDSQNAAKDVIDDALNAKTKEINDANNIDQTTKDQLIKEATDAANTAKEAIDKAITADAIKTAQDQGTTNINNVTVPSLEDAKKAATKAVDDALTAQTEVINKADNLSDAEKKDLIDQATTEANKAKDNIETATTNNEAAQAGQDGVDAIKKIVPTSLDTVKSDANKAIDDALTKKLEEINSASDLTTDEKTALIQEANTAADKAKEEITKATTNDAVIEAQNTGVTVINDIKVPTESTVKEAAKKAVADAATAKNNAIDSSNLTDEEKTALKQKVTDAQNAADQAIDDATTNTAVTEAQNTGINAIDSIEVTTSTAKEAAKKAVAEAATAKNNAIDASNLTAEEKTALKQEVTDAQSAADQAIDNATTNAAVTEAQTNGVNAIDGIKVPTTSTTKEQAITDLNKAVDEAKKAIDQDSNLTDEQRQAAKDQIDSDAKNAQDTINNAKTNDDVKKAADAGTLAIDKDVANAAIDNAVAGKKEEISNTSLTDEEKATLNNEVDEKATTAKEAINNAATPEAVTTAQENGIKNITNTEVPAESAAKQAAKEAVAKAADEKNAVIDSSNLTAEEKTALKQEVTDAQNAADQVIDNATTNAAVTEAQNNGVNAINGINVPSASTTKEQAITDLNKAVDEAKKAIDQDNNLTDEEKQTVKDQIDSDAKNAQDAINNAKTNDDVKKAVDAGTLTIDKDVANAAIDNAVAGKKAEISKSPLTDEEKTTLNNEVDQKAQDAKESINNATTPEAVTTAQENGIKGINETSVPTESAAKQAAKEAIAKAADEKNSAIDSSNLTDEEKAALKQEVTDAQNAADQAIDNATTNAAVTEAQDNGVKTIENIEVPATSANKEKAITDLNNEVEKAKQAIDQDSNLTDEEKQAVKSQIDTEAKTAQDAINSAKTDNEVNNAVNSGKVSIDKDVANAAIDNAVAGKLKEIQDPLTTDEKQAYTDLINSEANNAKQNIANATTVEEVTNAQTNGVNEITNTNIPTTSSAKNNAISAINDALQKKTDEINNASNINPQEKTDLINQATEAANAAKNNINNATTNADVDTAQTNGEKAIADVTVPNLSDVKKESIDLINKALDAKTDEINNASNLSQDEKQGLINDATNAATEAINNVNQSQTNDDAKAAATTGVQNIENVTIPSLDEAKKNANQAIDDALNSKVTEIKNASNLNDTEKQKLVDQATEAAATAKANVENATTNDDARDAANAGIDNIKGITFTSLEDAKKAANTAIDNALQVKTDEINNASNLSTDEKQDLINQATEVAKNAKDNIKNATTNDAVTEAQNKGMADIANVTVPSLDQVKQDAINAIKQVQDAKNKQISAASNLSAEERKELSDQVDKIASDAIAQINDSSTTTNDAVTATRDDAIKQITDLFIPTLDGAQTDAINAIESAKNAKLNDINNATHLTDQEKQALVDQTNKAADDATKEIKTAQTNDTVKSAETTGLDNINNITIPTLVQKQHKAIEELNAARDAKNSAIDDAIDLTTDEKNTLKDKVQAEYSNAVSNITSATTDEAVTTAKENGIAAIKDIEIPTKSAAKEQATTDLNTAVDEAKKAIDQDNNLTDEEKQAAKDQIDSDAKKAQEAIDNATTNDEVNSAVNNGKLAIDKDVANAAIDNAVAGKKEKISKSPLTDEEKTALNNEVDQKAQAAKEAINNATTLEAVSTAQESGIKNINNTEVPTESAAKEAAKKAVAEAAEAKNNAIDSSNLTDEEKATLKQEVTDAQNAANTAIDNATNNAAVTEAQDNGVKAINGIEVPTKSTTKEQATTDLNKAVDEAKKAIDQDNNLTEEEKQAAKDQIDSDAKNAQDAINTAKTNDDVKKTVDAGTLTIDKDVANAAIDNAVAGKKAEISKTPLTDEEKTSLNNEVDQKAQDAKEAINNATTPEAVTTAQDNGIKNINETSVPTESAAKQAAKEAIAKAADEKNSAIDSSNLTAEEKTALEQEVTDAQSAADQAIDNATTNAAVTEAQDKGVKAINGIEVPTKSTTKEQATTDLNTAVNEAKKAIDQDSNLTDEEKQAAKDQIDSDAKNAQDAINNAKTNDDVKKAVDAGTLTIDKDVANAAIDNAVAGKKAEISRSPLTDEEKTTLNNEVDQKAQDAKEAINAATTLEAVISAQENGIKNINDTEVPAESTAKQAAKEAVAKVAEEKNSAIDSSNLTDEEKAALKQEVTDAQNAANTAIDNATNNAAVTEAEENGIKAINSIEVPTKSTTKDQATTDLNSEVDDAKKAIDQDSNLTDEEKQAAKDQIDSDAKNAQDAINNAKTNDDVKKAINDGKLAIDKDIANAAIDNAVAGKKKEISESSLTAEEKTALNNEVDEKANTAKESINNATTPEAVISAQESGIKNINDTEVPAESAAKETAKKAVAEAAEAKNNAIDSSNLTDEEKAVLKQEVTDAQNAANTAIDNATTNAAVAEAQNNGIDKINSIEISAKSAAKEQATTDLNNEVDEAKKAIDQDNNLTDEQKQAAKDQIDSAAKKAQEAIDNAKSNDDVKKAVDDGKLAIDKDVANTAIDDAAAGKLKEISDSLTDEEKQAYTDLINNEADNAKQKIADSTTPEEVTRAQEEGVKEINNINVPTTSPAKDAANAAIDQALKNKEDEINSATNISSEEKQALINQATEAANTAKSNINNATTNAAVETAQVNGEKAIADVTVPGLSDIKKESIDLINKALNEKQAEINNSSNLSQDEKQDLIDQATNAATEAIDNINQAKTNDEAKEAADTGVKNIENISIPSLDNAKKNANQAIDDALNSKKNEINNATNLTDSEKTDLINKVTDIANTAKDNINKATINTDVKAAEDKGVADINDINFTNLDDSKKAANQAIDNALDAKKNEINNASNLSDSEKADLINNATEIAEKAHDAINGATTNDAVNKAENKGIEDIANVNVPSLNETKQSGVDAIKQVQSAKNSQIKAAKNLSADEQKSLIDQVNKIAQEAIDKINDPAITTNDAVTEIRDQAIDQITNLFIPTLDGAQKDATEAITSAKEAKIEEITNATNLTPQTKQDLIDQVTKAADDATKAINEAQTNDAVKEAETKGLEDINSIQVPSLVESKDKAIKAIDDALKQKTEEINAADLDQKQKDDLISQITKIATDTKNKVFNAITNADVDALVEAGIKAIESITIPAKNNTDNNGNHENNGSSTDLTLSHNDEDNTKPTTNHGETNTKKENSRHVDTVITNSVHAKSNTAAHHNRRVVSKKATLPQTGKKNSSLTLAGAVLLGLAGVLSLFGLGDKRKKNN